MLPNFLKLVFYLTLLKMINYQDLVVNFLHPGYVDTDMSSHKGPMSPEEGAKSSLFAALLPPNTEVKGKFIWKDCSIVEWVSDKPPTSF